MFFTEVMYDASNERPTPHGQAGKTQTPEKPERKKAGKARKEAPKICRLNLPSNINKRIAR
jgi:hypothetical protein